MPLVAGARFHWSASPAGGVIGAFSLLGSSAFGVWFGVSGWGFGGKGGGTGAYEGGGWVGGGVGSGRLLGDAARGCRAGVHRGAGRRRAARCVSVRGVRSGAVFIGGKVRIRDGMAEFLGAD